MARRNWIALVAAIFGLIALVAMNNAVTASVNIGSAYGAGAGVGSSNQNGVIWGKSYKNDVSPPLRDIPQIPVKALKEEDAHRNPFVAAQYADHPDPVVQRFMAPLAMPTPILNFDGIPFPG